MTKNIETLCVHPEGEGDCHTHYGSLSYPIYQTATFAHPGVGQSTGYDYARTQNPTREHLEKSIARLEHGVDALAFSTGMAAVSLLMELFEPGDHIISDEGLYGGSIRLFDHVSKKNGIEITYLDCSKQDATHYIKDNTKAIYIETPSNPMMNICDIEEYSKICKKYNLLLIVDNTFLTPYLQNPIDLGADIVVHSGTKYLGGHNDTLAGFLISKDEETAAKLRFLNNTTGANLSPIDSWLITRGIKTLAIRMDRSEENAKKIVEWLQSQDSVKEVLYPGIKTHPGYEIMKKQARGFGSMVTFQVKSGEFAKKVLSHLEVIAYAESLGGVESLMTYPCTQTHADVPEADRIRMGITDCTLRLSVGIENVDDLINDLKQAFEKGCAQK